MASLHNTRLSKSASSSKNKVPILNIMNTTKDICPDCQNSVGENEKGLNCDECRQWYHAPCLKIEDEKYDWLASSDNLLFVCDTCKVNRANEESLTNAALFIQMKDMMANMKVVLANQNKMMKTNDDLAFRVNKLETQNASKGVSEDIVKTIVEESIGSVVDTKIDDAIRESQEQEARKLNFIMVNVSENPGEDSKKKDQETVNKMMKKILPDEEVEIDDVTRLGEANIGNRPRFLRVKVKSMDIKRKIMKNSSKLNEGTDVTDPRKKMYINMDYTKKEREVNKALREELKNKPEEERVKYQIRFGKLVLKGDPPQGGPGKKE